MHWKSLNMKQIVKFSVPRVAKSFMSIHRPRPVCKAKKERK